MCLDITHFPQYDYYPQYFEIEVYVPSWNYTTKICVKLKDCDNDDPSCQTYFSFPSPNNSENRNSNLPLDNKIPPKSSMIRVYDLMGKLIYQGEESSFYKIAELYRNRILIFSYFESEGNYPKFVKRVILE